MKDVLLATCEALPDGDEDAAALTRALRERGVRARWAAWTDPRIDWSAGLVVLRSTWDYTHDRDRFVQWVSALPRVLNPARVVTWNSDKTYLADLADAGVPVVPSGFVAPGEDVALPQAAELVVKPTVGAGSRGVGRFTADRADAARAHVAGLHRAGRTVLVQPYLSDVDTAGETALIFVDGVFSHAVRKGPMLGAATTHAVDGPALWIEENITVREPDRAERQVAQAALAAVRERFGTDLLYTRVDLLPTPDGPRLGELELVEPSLFLSHGVGAAGRLADAIAARA